MPRIPKKVTRSFSMGQKESELKVLIDQYIKQYGKGRFSKLMRFAAKVVLKEDPLYANWKKMVAIQQYKEILLARRNNRKSMQTLADKLVSLGIDPMLVEDDL